jgi:hypothetical protein
MTRRPIMVELRVRASRVSRNAGPASGYRSVCEHSLNEAGIGPATAFTTSNLTTTTSLSRQACQNQPAENLRWRVDPSIASQFRLFLVRAIVAVTNNDKRERINI